MEHVAVSSQKILVSKARVAVAAGAKLHVTLIPHAAAATFSYSSVIVFAPISTVRASRYTFVRRLDGQKFCKFKRFGFHCETLWM